MRRIAGRRRRGRRGRTDDRDLAGATRRRDDARRAARRAVLAAAGDRGEPALDGADARLGHRGRDRAGGVDVEWRGWQSTTLAASPRVDVAGRPARRASRRPCSARPPRHACPRTTSSRCCWSTCGPWAPRACSWTPRWSASRPGPTASRSSCATSRPATLRTVRARYLIAADGAHSRIRTALGIAMRGPDGIAHVVNALFRAPLWRLLGEHRYGIYSVDRPDGAGHFLPAGPRRPLGLRNWVDRAEPRATRRVVRASASAPAPASPTSTSRSSASAPSASPPSWPTASAPATSSWPVTPPTA